MAYDPGTKPQGPQTGRPDFNAFQPHEAQSWGAFEHDEDDAPEAMRNAVVMMRLGRWIPRVCGLLFVLIVIGLGFMALESATTAQDEPASAENTKQVVSETRKVFFADGMVFENAQLEHVRTRVDAYADATGHAYTQEVSIRYADGTGSMGVADTQIFMKEHEKIASVEYANGMEVFAVNEERLDLKIETIRKLLNMNPSGIYMERPQAIAALRALENNEERGEEHSKDDSQSVSTLEQLLRKAQADLASQGAATQPQDEEIPDSDPLLSQATKEAAALAREQREQREAEQTKSANQTELVQSPDEPWSFAGWMDRILPDNMKRELLGIKIWQIIAVFLTILLGVFVDFTVRLLLKYLATYLIERRGVDKHKRAINKTVRPFGLGLAALVWVLLLMFIGFDGISLIILMGAAQLFATLAWIWSLWRLVDLVADVLMDRAELTSTKIDDVIVPLIRKSLKIFIIVMGIVYAASALNFEIMPLLASIGIGSLAFAFAAKDTIENFFGSITVLVDRPFEVGDWVIVDGNEGTVEQIGFRSTRIRTFYNSQVTLPNSTLVRATVDNMGRREYRRTKCYIGVQYDTSTEKLIAFREGIHELVRNHPHTRKDYYQVWFNQFGPSSLDILIYVFFKVQDWTMELREKERFFLDIKRLAEELGVEFAFPTQTVHLFKHEGNEPHMPPAPPMKDTDGHSMLMGIKAAQSIIEKQPWRERTPGPHEFRGRTDLSEFREDKGDQQSEDVIGPMPIPKDAGGGS